MKKFLLSAATIFVFVAYAIHQRTDSESAKVVAPKNLASNNISATPSTTSGASPTLPSTNNSPSSSNSSGSMMNGSQMMDGYKDGQYTGNSADAFYGYIQVKATISGGKITDVVFLDYPQDRNTSVRINSQAIPYLKQEAIAAQSANVDIISGATDSSTAFIESLGSALAKAKA